MSLERDSRLGKYIIRQRLAGGGQGVVYRARDAQLGRDVALKTILADKAADKDFVSRFRREALSIAQIEHPNIVSLIDFVEGDPSRGEISYMVMEYLKGKDLGKLIKETGPLEIVRAVDRILEVCAAVGTCHRRGFLHRDLKPTNIFITQYDHIELAKVLDFGVAKMWAEHPVRPVGLDGEELTKQGTVFGTPEYIAPELLRNKPPTPKVDQYAIGVVLYAALTGRKPFMADPKADIPDLDLYQAVARGHHPKPREIRGDIPPGLEAVVERAMSLNPDDRFRDIHELGANLLGWASEAARHRWTAHFTSAPSPIEPQHSIVIDGGSRDSTIPAPAIRDTTSTIADQPDKRRTLPVGTEELRRAGESTAAAARRPAGARELQGSSISIVLDETSARVQAPTASGTLSAPQRAPGTPFFRRPIALVVAGSFVLFAAIAIAALLHRSKPPVSTGSTPPPVILDRAVPARGTPPRPPAVQPMPAAASTTPPSPAPTTPEAIAPVPSARSETAPSPARRPTRKRPKPQAVDEKGFPIPSE